VIEEETKKEIIMKFGGIKEQCIKIVINKKINKASIEDLIYRKKCSIFNTLNKSKNNKNNNIILLLKSALLYCVKKYPEINIYEINDMSYINCGNYQRIPLSDLYVIKHGKTWYEYYFDARPINQQIKYIDEYKQTFKKILDTILDLNTDEFIKEYYLTTEGININKNINNITKAYKKDIKVRDYLDYFFENNLDCRLYLVFIQRIFGFLFYGKIWQISKETILNYSLNINIFETEKINEHTNLDNLYNQLTDANNEII
jgi:hypothetical protein